MENNQFLDPMMSMATSSLYALENQKMVQEHIDEYITDLQENMSDADYRESISALKPKGRITGGITLPRANNVFCFVSKIWYTIQKSSSERYEWYWLKIGVNIRHDKYNPMSLSQVYFNRMAGGQLDDFIQEIQSPEFAETVKKSLCDAVYDACNESIAKAFGSDTGDHQDA